MTEMTLEQKKLLDPFGQIFAAMGSQVHAMDDKALQEALAACYVASVTNCWCCSFEAAQWLQRELRRELHQRKQRADQPARAAQGG